MSNFCMQSDILNCPNCNGETLHQESVNVYFRDEDSDVGVVAEVDRDTVSVNTKGDCVKGNPSARRDGVVINFRCECCDVIPRLAIIQHKGTTYFEWMNGKHEVKFGYR